MLSSWFRTLTGIVSQTLSSMRRTKLTEKCSHCFHRGRRRRPTSSSLLSIQKQLLRSSGSRGQKSELFGGTTRVERVSSCVLLLSSFLLMTISLPHLPFAQDMSHSFDMSHHVEDNIMSAVKEEEPEEITYEIPVLHQLECNAPQHEVWQQFNKLLYKGNLNAETIRVANELATASLSDQMGLYEGVDAFFHDICDLELHQTPTCVYGIFNALVVLGLAGDTDYAKNGLTLLGSLQCLDYVESSTWRFKSTDLLSILQNSTSWTIGERHNTKERDQLPDFSRKDVSSWMLHLASGGGPGTTSGGAVMMPGGFGGHRVATTSTSSSSSSTAILNENGKITIQIMLFGTHPTLTLEPYTMIADHVFPDDQYDIDLQGVFGIAYKCHLYPLLCNDQDPIAGILGAFDKADESYTTESSISTLKLVFESLLSAHGGSTASASTGTAQPSRKLFVCTSPFFLCAVIAASLLPKDALSFNYLGLPALWKAPHDFAQHQEVFWDYGHRLFLREGTTHVTNNPILFEQLRYQFGKTDTEALRILRPHNRYMNAYYVPRKHLYPPTAEELIGGAGGGDQETSSPATSSRSYVPAGFTAATVESSFSPRKLLHYVGVVSRTKFQWVTFECLLKRMIHFGKLPFAFDVLNTDSKKTFLEMASYTAIVLIPWEAALMSFYEFYSMNMPLFLPSREMLYRTVYHSEGNLGTTKDSYQLRSSRLLGKKEELVSEHPYPPFAFSSLDSRAYWLDYSDFVRWPGLKFFFNLQELCKHLLQEDVNAMAAEMKLFNDKTFASSVAFYKNALKTFF
ncbi:unnamed protein product [Amoebophrya sp. A120]|nr:unnamed protein product [Amoebophrya sp. A120]|eukprot:GSA120T00011641001.1